MKAGFKNFFGTNLEEEVVDKVVILPVATRNNNNGTISLPVNMKWVDFECLYISMGVNTSSSVCGTSEIPLNLRNSQPNAWSSLQSFSNAVPDGQRWRLEVKATSDSTAEWVGTATTGTTWPMTIVGCKRRISRVGIDELMSAMSLPNLIANADLTDNPINQRNFNGNWSSLAVGDYGYDGWMKVSATHMGYAVEAGKYRPSTKHTLTKDDVVIGEFMSPASGHWSVAVPFATSGKFDLYAGQFKRPWHPVLDGLRRCQRYYQFIGYIKINGGYIISAGQGLSETHKINEVMRVMPKTSFEMEANLNISSATIDPSLATQGYIQVNPTQSAYAAGYRVYLKDVVLDASIALAELNGQIITV